MISALTVEYLISPANIRSNQSIPPKKSIILDMTMPTQDLRVFVCNTAMFISSLLVRLHLRNLGVLLPEPWSCPELGYLPMAALERLPALLLRGHGILNISSH